MITEKVSVIPSIIGTLSKYCNRLVFANSKYLAQSNLAASKVVIVLPINKRKMEMPIASELFRKAADIMNAMVVNITNPTEDNKKVTIKFTIWLFSTISPST